MSIPSQNDGVSVKKSRLDNGDAQLVDVVKMRNCGAVGTERRERNGAIGDYDYAASGRSYKTIFDDGHAASGCPA